MKKYTILGLLLLCSTVLTAQNLFVGTYNIRQKNDHDVKEGNGWNTRYPVICDMLSFEQPDIFGTQEAFYDQLQDLKRGMRGYDYIGVARDDGKREGEHSAIFYNTATVKCLDHGDFWLNETPDQPKLGWDAACVRICTWGKFQLKDSKKKFYFFNLHMDHVGVVARRNASKLVVSKIKEIAGDNQPVILTGDFNVDQHDEIFKIFTQSGFLHDAYETAQQRFAENGTFQDFDANLKTDSRIDHVLVTPKFAVDHYGILTNGYWTPQEGAKSQGSAAAPKEIRMTSYIKRTPSDHYPVFAKIHFTK